jgi:superfamily II DNA or RNA helicase
MYQAARIVLSCKHSVTSLELAMRYLEMMGLLTPPPSSTPSPSQLSGVKRKRKDTSASLVAELADYWYTNCHKFTRIKELQKVLVSECEKRGDALRCIVFTKMKVSTHVLKYALSTHERLSRLPTAVIHSSTTSKHTPSCQISQKDVLERVNYFASGSVRLLIATAVAEEGMDIPQANCVIRFDCIENLVSMVQSRGRARQQHSSFVVLSERPECKIADLVAAESTQKSMIAEGSFHEAIAKAEELCSEERIRAVAAEKAVFLRSHLPALDATKCLNKFVSQFKCTLRVKDKPVQSESESVPMWRCSMTLESRFDEPIKVETTEGLYSTVLARKAAVALLLTALARVFV